MLGDARFNSKGTQIYNQMKPWLGKGILTINGETWHSRRKLLTKAFHFQILQDFLPVMNNQVQTLVNDILPKVADTGKPEDISMFVKNYTMDVICEAAMGVDMDVQRKPNEEYPKAIRCLTRVIVDKAVAPRLWFEPLFALTHPQYLEYRKSLRVVQRFTDHLIKTRRQNLSEREEEYTEKKKRLAFLDLLLDASDNGKLVTDQDIKDEV